MLRSEGSGAHTCYIPMCPLAGSWRAAIMARPVLEVADIFRDHGPAWRRANAGHVSLGQMKVMSAIESCRTAALGGHVVRCEHVRNGNTPSEITVRISPFPRGPAR